MARKIHQSYLLLVSKGEIKHVGNSVENVHETFNKLIASSIASCFKILMLHNLSHGQMESDMLARLLKKDIIREEMMNTKEKVLVKKKNEKTFKYVEIDKKVLMDKM
jgi:hypothetical protein